MRRAVRSPQGTPPNRHRLRGGQAGMLAGWGPDGAGRSPVCIVKRLPRDVETTLGDHAGTSCERYNVPVPQNERLRAAQLASGKTVGELAEAAGVDPKTFERWVANGRTPHRVNAARAATALGQDASYLWPDIERGHRQRGIHPDLIAVYATRAGAPLEVWRALFEQADERIGILVYAAVFLHELWPDFNRLLSAKASQGCKVTILIGDPDADAVILRGREEAYGHGIEARCRQALMHYAPLIGTAGIEVRQHKTTLYNSIYVGDDIMIVNTHRYGMNAYATPVLHMRRAAEGGLFDGYTDSFEQVRRLSRPAQRQSAKE